jgi:hypothetical protein
MIFKRDPKPQSQDIEDQKTVLVGPSPSQRRPAWPARDGAALTSPQEEKTGRQHREPAKDPGVDPERTRIISAPGGTGNNEAPAPGNAGHDPVAGWLVVIRGPGRGRSIEIAAGMNAIGRTPDQRIRLDFGDEKISRIRHAAFAFDVRTSRFFFTHGDGKNLSYIDGDPVLVPTELNGGEIVSIGDTELKFIRLCGPDFSWA